MRVNINAIMAIIQYSLYFINSKLLFESNFMRSKTEND